MSIYIALATQPELAAATLECLYTLGVAPAKPSRRENFSPAEINEIMLKALSQHQSSCEQANDDVVFNRLGTELATDLLLANLDYSSWAWCQLFDPYTPTFWQRFGPATRFVIAFSAPAEYLAQTLVNQTDIPVHSLHQLVPAVLGEWMEHHASLLKFYYSCGNQAVLLHASQLTCSQALAQKLGLFVKPLPKMAPVAKKQNSSDLQISLLHQIAFQHPNVLELWAEIQAVAQLPCPDFEWENTAPIDLWCAMHEYKQAIMNQACTLQTTLDSQIRAQAESAKEYYVLLAQLHQVQEELEASLLLGQANEQRLCELEAALAVSQEKFSTLQATLGYQVMQQIEIKDENELLLAQLLQVQEELEHYFLKYQTTTDNHRLLLAPLQFVSDFWCTHAPTELWLDTRRHLHGQGWYESEIDGRWTGPESLSTLYLPPLSKGCYSFELHIADAMHTDIVVQLKVFAVFSNGRTESVDLVHEFGIGDSVFPMTCVGLVNLPEMGDPWQLHMQVPHNICPAEKGGGDTRHLGVRVQGVRLRLRAA